MASCIGRKPGDLTSSDLGTVLEELVEVSTQWYHIGLQLSIDFVALDDIKGEYVDSQDSLLEMLKFWFVLNWNPSWMKIVSALRSRLVGQYELASIIERKHVLRTDNTSLTGLTPPQLGTQPGVKSSTEWHPLHTANVRVGPRPTDDDRKQPEAKRIRIDPKEPPGISNHRGTADQRCK